MAKFNARKAAEDMRLKPVDRIEQALKAPNWRYLPGRGAAYMPELAMYRAGYRQHYDRLTCTFKLKSRGRSIPLV